MKNKILFSIFLFLISGKINCYFFYAIALKKTFQDGEHYIYLLGDRHIDDTVPFYELNLVNEFDINHYNFGKNISSTNALQALELFEEIKKRLDGLLIIEDISEDCKLLIKKYCGKNINLDSFPRINTCLLFKLAQICKLQVPTINVEFRSINDLFEILEKNENLKIELERKLTIYKKFKKTYLNEIKQIESEIKKVKDEVAAHKTVRDMTFQSLLSIIEEIRTNQYCIEKYDDNKEFYNYYIEELNKILKELNGINSKNLSHRLCYDISSKLIDLRFIHNIFSNQNKKHIFVCGGASHTLEIRKALMDKLDYKLVKCKINIGNDIKDTQPVDIAKFFSQLPTESRNFKLKSKL